MAASKTGLSINIFGINRGLQHEPGQARGSAWLGIKTVQERLTTMNESINLDETMQEVRACATRMNAEYGSTVFDEWVVVSLQLPQARVLAYSGPRGQDFRQTFARDLGTLKSALLTGGHQVGDFEFARHATGTCFEGFMALGNEEYLICNNTQSSMDEITKNPRWLSAQVPFADLSEKMCARQSMVEA
jgi:hypothetical protein